MTDDTRRRARELVALGDAWFASCDTRNRIHLDAGIILSAMTHFLRDMADEKEPRPLVGLDFPQQWFSFEDPRKSPPKVKATEFGRAYRRVIGLPEP
jgi:hypothetical protein